MSALKKSGNPGKAKLVLNFTDALVNEWIVGKWSL